MSLPHPFRSLQYPPHHPLGVGGNIYNNHTLEPLKELGLYSQRIKKLASKLHVHSVNYAAELDHNRRILSSTIINSHQQEMVKPATLLIPISFLHFLLVKEFYGTR